jgi:hypothetical protein
MFTTTGKPRKRSKATTIGSRFFQVMLCLGLAILGVTS